MDNSQLSPAAAEPVAEETMDFPDAIREVIKGNWITRISWDPLENSYGLLMEGSLMLHLHGEYRQWLLNDGDLEATDWIIVNG